MFFKLSGKEVVECTAEEFSAQFENFNLRRVCQTKLVGGVTVSTIFLGTDHGFGGPPLWFETMIFGRPDEDEYQVRYETYDEALIGHGRAVELVKGDKP